MTTNGKMDTDRVAARVERGERKMVTNRKMSSTRKIALVAGVLYLITIIASIPAQFVLYGPVLNNPDYIVSSGADTQVLLGGFFEMITALACIGTAVVLFPVVKRQNEAAALGFVTARVFEASLIVVGIVSLLSVVTLRQDLAGAAGTATLLGLNEQVSVWTVIATAPIFAWELSLGLWLIVKGFDPSVIASE